MRLIHSNSYDDLKIQRKLVEHSILTGKYLFKQAILFVWHSTPCKNYFFQPYWGIINKHKLYIFKVQNVMFSYIYHAAAKSLQLCLTLYDPIDGSPPGSPVPGILQARTLEWVAISFSNAWKWKVKLKSLSHVWLLVTPWTAAHKAPPSMGFARQDYWSELPLPSPK